MPLKKILIILEYQKFLTNNRFIHFQTYYLRMKYIILFSVCLLSFSSLHSQQKIGKYEISSPYDVREYFLLMPKSVFDASEKAKLLLLECTDYRMAWEKKSEYKLTTLDLGNGFMAWGTIGDGGGSNYQLTYFTKTDKSRIVAFQELSWSMCCEVTNHIHFFDVSASNIWTDVTNKYLPALSFSDFYNQATPPSTLLSEFSITYDLPQKGTTIKAFISHSFFEYMDEKDKNWSEKNLRYNMLDLLWEKGHFEPANFRKSNKYPW